MKKNKNAKRSQLSVRNILFWAVGILFILTMLSLHFTVGTYAKYVVVGDTSGSARVAAGGNLELLEHEATLENGIYKLDLDEEVTSNTYEKVIPGVDIAKDPFIRLDIEASEVSYELYIKVIESNKFPATVTYELTENWELVDEANGIYKYKDVFAAGTPYTDDIKILEDDKLYISEHYVGNGQEFSLSFSAYLKQAD